jgi:hypothetical protein
VDPAQWRECLLIEAASAEEFCVKLLDEAKGSAVDNAGIHAVDCFAGDCRCCELEGGGPIALRSLQTAQRSPMGPGSRHNAAAQERFRKKLVNLIDQRHEPVKLASLIDCLASG